MNKQPWQSVYTAVYESNKLQMGITGT